GRTAQPIRRLNHSSVTILCDASAERREVKSRPAPTATVERSSGSDLLASMVLLKRVPAIAAARLDVVAMEVMAAPSFYQRLREQERV
ncbi:hypothetical protein U1Q18_012950, partial [Sarracenia purpurea var. burkii]